jgi:hypothetical protein
MKQATLQDVNTVIDTRSDDIAEICFFQEKNYGKIDDNMLFMEIENIVKDIWNDYRKLVTKKAIKAKIFAFLDMKNRRHQLSSKN